MKVTRTIRDLFSDSFTGEWGAQPQGEAGTAVLRSTNFGVEGRLDLSDVVRRKIEPSILERKKLERGDTLLEKSGGGPEQPVGRVVYFDHPIEATCSNFIQVCRPKGDNDPHYVFYLLDHFYRTGLTLQFQQQTTGLMNLKLADFFQLKVSPPPKDSQTSIAGVLATVDGAIEQTEALLAKQQRIKAGLMHDLLTRGLDAKGQLRPSFAQAPNRYWESPIGWIPKDWKADPIEELCDDIVDCPHSTPQYGSGDIPCIRTADMIPGKLLLQEAFRVSLAIYRERILRLEPRKGDIIYSREGERLGIAAPVEDERICLGQRVMLLRPKQETDSTFMTWAMNSPAFFNRIALDQIATTSPHVNVRDIKKALIVRPQPAEQRGIGKALTGDDAENASLLNCVEKLRRQKTGLMQDLLTGRVPVTPLLATTTN